ncbi:hypothetical protein FJR45_08360 [Sulfurimonas sediminis]|uniref:Uncharacterized protein n=1 Tax=Sulfurimonas sediminis TaxID=2590020 RepID=A0A7M1B2H1_9BACT|nr:hypothetical protein [Sulfurimonas sediminis]QOP43959.1 hypothetical protein FJR45_08360 [Sulfurimonas sediminis]
MTLHDVMIILVLTFPMFIFTIYPAIRLSDYLEAHHGIQESQKRSVMLVVTFLGALFLSSLLYYI